MRSGDEPRRDPGDFIRGGSVRGSCEIELHGERLVLHPARAVVWPARQTVIVADTHFGKDDVFRRAGIAIPRGPAIADLQRLAGLVSATRSTRAIVLGDFVHAATRGGDSFLHAFAVWRRAHTGLEIDVVAGNHDRREARDKWGDLVRWHERSLVDPPFVFAHEPSRDDAGHVLAGHLHPVIQLPGLGAAGRVPVFWLRPEWLVLPSFGSFTGGASIRPESGDAVYAVAPESVVKLPV